MNNSSPIVVAVGLTDVEAALHYAALEALLRDAPLHLVHVLRIPAVDVYADAYGGILEDAGTALDDGVRRARELTDGRVPVTSERVDEGALVARLVQSADHGRMIVLEHRHLSRPRRLVTGSIVNGVAARAHVPVVAVPDGWRLAERPARVTAAVQDVHEAPALLRAAYDEARIRRAELVIVHAWWTDTEYDVLPANDEYLRQRATAFENQTAPLLEAMKKEMPDVAPTIEVRHAPPAETLLDASQRSDVLVIGRRHHLLPLGTHLGPVARAVLDRSECPVLVAPEAASDTRTAGHAHGRLTGVMY